uniref:Chromosome 6 open reading frame 136 n=1 Tax=Nothobranchius korthausae TaxID=1143690 RepID=A0A1A8G5C0_9TELE
MATRRGGVAFWVGFVCSHSGRQPILKRSWILSQVVNGTWSCRIRPLSSAPWTLAPPNSLRYRTTPQPLLSHPLHHASSQQRKPCYKEDWEGALSVCVLVPSGESNNVLSLLELPVVIKPGDMHTLGTQLEFSFPVATVDGSREDDIMVEEDIVVDELQTQRGHLRNLLEAEHSPASVLYGSQLLHCSGSHTKLHRVAKSSQAGDANRTAELLLYSGKAEEKLRDGEHELEENLALMYERLSVELPSFFRTSHDYTMYSNNVEFINGLLNTRTRGRLVYRVMLSSWRFLCLCYYADARLDVLKLTKHMEDGSIKARWRIKGLPFHSLLLRFYRKDRSQLYRSFDAFSTFYIGPDGLIHCHKVEKVMPAQPPVLPRFPSLLTGALVALGVQEHRPALNLLPYLLFSRCRN